MVIVELGTRILNQYRILHCNRSDITENAIVVWIDLLLLLRTRHLLRLRLKLLLQALLFL